MAWCAWILLVCVSAMSDNPIVEKQHVAALERELECEGRIRQCLVKSIEGSPVIVG